MDRYVINGGRPLKGTVPICGAKNAAVAILPAVICSDEPCVIENIPNISDVEAIVSILEWMGAKVERPSKNSLRIDATTITSCEVPAEMSRKMRASYYFLGALLSRYRRAQVSLPGGCDLGPRPIDQHLKSFTALGCQWKVEHGDVVVWNDQKLRGDHVFFDTVSVGATINAMLAAVKAEGTTVLENVAKEPHIVDVANFLNSMGGDVRGAGTDVIKIRGVDYLRGTEYSIVPDQIEAGTYMAAAVATKGDLLITNVIPKHLESIASKLEHIGAEIIDYDDAVRVRFGGRLRPTNIKTAPHPGFPTDMQSQVAVLLAMAEGTSIITEGIWDSRFKYVDELRRMGAKIQVDTNGKQAVVQGVEKLMPASLKATDLRAGAALIIAALAADGESTVSNISHVERGYEDIVGKLAAVGADIRKETVFSD